MKGPDSEEIRQRFGRRVVMTVSLLESLSQQRKNDVAHRHTRVCDPFAPECGETGHDFLAVSRSDIEFFNVGADPVAIEIRVSNPSSQASLPAVAVVSAAPFGAFVPWQPLVTLPIPSSMPGQIRFLRTRAVAVQPAPLGRPDSVPPRRLLGALGLAGDSPREPSRQKGSALSKPDSARLPADLMQLLLQETPHWAGNINVHVGNKDVERHLARALRVYPGRLNMAWFFVGGPGRDAYAFRLGGLGKTWDANLFDMTSRESLVLNVQEAAAIGADEWIGTDGTRILLLAMRPPNNCSAGVVEVAVTQRSSGRTAVVEFSLDPTAAGRGCYVV